MSQPPDDRTPSPSDQEQESAGEHLPLIDLDTLLTRPPSRRKRFIQAGLVLAALAVVLVTFWNVFVPKVPKVPPVSVLPTQLPPTLSILSNLTYGTITINGQPQRGSIPLLIKMRSQPPYQITLAAPPFRPLTCQFPPPGPVTPGIFDPCVETGALTSSKQPVNVLEMLFTLADLPTAQQQQITAFIPQAITTRQDLDVPAQSYIVTGTGADGTIRTQHSTAPLRASVFLVPGSQTFQGQGGAFCQGSVCEDVTSGFQPDSSRSGHFWEVLTPIALRWRFTTASGQVLSEVTFPSTRMLTLFLTYDAATGWSLAPFPASAAGLSQHLAQLACETGGEMLGIEQARYLSGEGWEITTLHDAGVAGCELDLTQNTVDAGHFVWRFGVLLAADAKAHNTLPLLPLASPADLAAVVGG